MRNFVGLNCNMFGEKDLEMRTLRAAAYYVGRFRDCCDNRTYHEHGKEMDACIRNLKNIVAKMEGKNEL